MFIQNYKKQEFLESHDRPEVKRKNKHIGVWIIYTEFSVGANEI